MNSTSRHSIESQGRLQDICTRYRTELRTLSSVLMNVRANPATAEQELERFARGLQKLDQQLFIWTADDLSPQRCPGGPENALRLEVISLMQQFKSGIDELLPLLEQHRNTHWERMRQAKSALDGHTIYLKSSQQS